jgi:hypothetical protein
MVYGSLSLVALPLGRARSLAEPQRGAPSARHGNDGCRVDLLSGCLVGNSRLGRDLGRRSGEMDSIAVNRTQDGSVVRRREQS